MPTLSPSGCRNAIAFSTCFRASTVSLCLIKSFASSNSIPKRNAASTEGPVGYHETLLFKSKNPFDFGTYTGAESEVAARLEAHAPEYIVDPETNQSQTMKV